jgi:3-carboxy-cis,cis-muconate cycloisomerase
MGWPVFDQGFSTPELTAVFSPETRAAAILEFEAALAMALADAGIAPVAEAEAVAAACRDTRVDAASILDSTWEAGTPLIALRDAVTVGLGEEVGRWFHYGATTQDAVDTAHMLQTRQALSRLEEMLIAVARRLHDLTIEYADQPHMARTFLQDAVPTTFGFRTATWLDMVLDQVETMRARRQSLAVQLGGPVGTLDGYGETAVQLRASLAERLSLAAPDISWHSDRGRILDLARAAESTALAMAKIGLDIALLSSSPIAEVEVRSGRSSSMSHKRNPMDSVRARAAATVCSGAVSMLTSSTSELDRGIGGWHVEWVALPLAMQSCGAAVEAMGQCLNTLEVDRETMTANARGDRPVAPGIQAQIDAVSTRFHDLLG